MGKLYVSNIPFTSTEDDVISHFQASGSVESVRIIKNHDTGKSRGFCFIEMENSEKAMNDLQGSNLDGRAIRIAVAVDKPRNESRY